MLERASAFVSLQSWILERKLVFWYLILDSRNQQFGAVIKVGPDPAFYSTIAEHLNAYLEKGQMPPDDIAPVILNLADDHLSGRQMIIRSGDYIAIRNHMRTHK